MIKIFAHRGASAEAPDNTPEAVQRALEIGVDGVEVDCLMTKDNVPVVTHEDNLLVAKRARGFVRNKTWKEIKTLGYPNLAQILELIRKSKSIIILDIKSQPGWMNKGPRIIADLALEILPPEQILASSFSIRHLLALKNHFPKLPRGLILSPTAFKLVPPKNFDKLLQVHSVHPCLKGLKRESIQKWKEPGLKIYTWVANSDAEFRRCVELGVDGFFTDDPRSAKKFLT